MRRTFQRFAADAGGSTAVEYSIIIAGIALFMLLAMLSFAGELQALYTRLGAGVASLSNL